MHGPAGSLSWPASRFSVSRAHGPDPNCHPYLRLPYMYRLLRAYYTFCYKNLVLLLQSSINEKGLDSGRSRERRKE